MKKYVNPVPSGGAPLHNNRLTTELNEEIWNAMEALLSKYDADTEGVIVSGCVLSDNAGNFDMTAGIVYLNGEFMRIAAATNQTFPSYIIPSTVTYIQKTFADATPKNLIEVSGAELDGSTPVSGQYITISSLTAARRAEQALDDTIQFVLDGGGAVLTTGEKGHIVIPFDCLIQSVTALADQSGSIVVDIWKDTYANFPPANADSITASAPVTISATKKSTDSTLTGWTKSWKNGEIIAYNIDSITTCTRVTISLAVKKI